MKIFNIQSYRPLNLTRYGERHNNTLQLEKSPKADVVSFGSGGEHTAVSEPLVSYEPFTKRDLKNLPDVPCVYCGEPMLSVPQMAKIVSEMEVAKGESLVKLLKSNAHYLASGKFLIAEKIIDKAKRCPDLNIQQILTELVPEHLPPLENEQMAVLRKIERKYMHLFNTQEQKDVMSMFLYDTDLWIHNESGENRFKIKEFYNELHNLLCMPIFHDKKLNKNILKTAKEMPQSMISVNAFIVKYASRPIKEITEQLFHEALVSIEHIKPQNDGGRNALSNYSLAHTICNKNRAHIPMKEFAKVNQNTEKNIKMQLDYLYSLAVNNEVREKYLNNKPPKDIFKYVSDIARTYMIESGGTLNLDNYIL